MTSDPTLLAALVSTTSTGLVTALLHNRRTLRDKQAWLHRLARRNPQGTCASGTKGDHSFDCATKLLVTLDNAGCIVYVNPAFLDWAGRLAFPDPTGQGFTEAFPGLVRQPFDASA